MGTYDAEVQDAIEFAAREMAEEEHKLNDEASKISSVASAENTETAPED